MSGRYRAGLGWLSDLSMRLCGSVAAYVIDVCGI